MYAETPGVGRVLHASDERRRLGRKVGRAAFNRPRRREVGGEPLDAELMKPLRAGQVLQPVVAEVAEAETVALREQVARGLGDEHLAAVGSRGDAGGAMHAP